ncbi:hypothetical protein C0J52_21899 [Blattella germanica]|nr:hypothetical protein C0J52_21899 [Blattella germanica]
MKQFRFDTEIENSIEWRRFHTREDLATLCSATLRDWTMEQRMVLAVFFIVGSDRTVVLGITSKDVDVLKMC